MRAGRFAEGAFLVFAGAVLAPSAAGADEGPVAPPPLAVTVTPGTGGGPWTLRVENTGEVPVRLVADPRLLALELTRPAEAEPEPAKKPPGKRKKAAPAATTLRCALPADTRPTSDEGPAIVVPGKRSWSTSFDPLYLCFGARERKALLPGVAITPTYGWPLPAARRGKAPPAPQAPYAVTPVGAAVGKITPAKQLIGATFMLAEVVTAEPAQAAPAAEATEATEATEASAASAQLALSTPEALDVARPTNIATTVTLTNESARAATLLFRPTTVQFKVSGPAGTVSCGTKAEVESPIRELFVTVGARRRAQHTMLLTSVCPPGTFDEPGVYRVVPRLDTTSASGRPLGLRTWDGEIEATRPLLVRVRNPRAPRQPSRPTLD
jgi:hypothetical protein